MNRAKSTHKADRCLRCYESLSSGIYHEKCSIQLFGTKTPPQLQTTTAEVENRAKELLKQRITVTGVQKKLSLHFDHKSSNRLTIVGTLGGNYILKPPSPEYVQMPEIEDLSMSLAMICGIKTAKHGLIPMQDGSLAYITRRFDRENNTKIAVEDLCQLSETLTENKYRLSSEKTGKIIRKFSSIPGDDVLRFFELLLFSYIIGNNDMHLKNFSFITQNPQRIVLSPAYDLLAVRLIISVKEDPEEMALSINDKKNRLKLTDWYQLGAKLKIPENVCGNIMKRFTSKQEELFQKIKLSFLSSDLQQQFEALITSRIKLLTG